MSRYFDILAQGLKVRRLGVFTLDEALRAQTPGSLVTLGEDHLRRLVREAQSALGEAEPMTEGTRLMEEFKDKVLTAGTPGQIDDFCIAWLIEAVRESMSMVEPDPEGPPLERVVEDAVTVARALLDTIRTRYL